jgi:cbb3-type cytochrome oxidase subunit 3
MDPKKAYNIFITVVILFFVTGCIYIVYKKDGRTRYNLASMYDKRSGTDLNDFSLSFQTAYDSGNFLEANKVADGEFSKKYMRLAAFSNYLSKGRICHIVHRRQYKKRLR